MSICVKCGKHRAVAERIFCMRCMRAADRGDDAELSAEERFRQNLKRALEKEQDGRDSGGAHQPEAGER